MKIATSSQMKDLDQMTINQTGIPGSVLMENAGRATADILLRSLSDISGKFLVICGPGNNGGDGFVISRYLFNRGCDVAIVLSGSLDSLKDAAGVFSNVASNIGIPVYECDHHSFSSISKQIQNSDVIIDALFGTGITRPAQNVYKFLIDSINSSDAFVCSVDIPSGLNADSCELTGPAVKSDITVTFGLPKPALLLYPSAEHAGQVYVADISIPQSNVDHMELPGDILTPSLFPLFFLSRKPDSHKGKHGHLFTIAGTAGKTGASILAAQAAARTGAGLITAAIPATLNTILETHLTEVMTLPLPGDSSCFVKDHLDTVLQEMHRKTAALIGPGIGTDPQTIMFINELLPQIDIPLLLDADALNIVSIQSKPGWNKKLIPVITPHPGEFSRLSGQSIEKIMSDPIQSAINYASRHSCIVVLKSARSVIAFPDESYRINVTGNACLASGGSGDLLSGIISGLMAQGIPVNQAVSAGVFWHGLSADIAVDNMDQTSIIASDLLNWMGKARMMMYEKPEVFDDCCIPFIDLY